MRNWVIFLSLWASAAWAAPFRPEQLMILLVGASSTRPGPEVIAILEHLQQLRQQPAFASLKIGTMHFDRPKESRFAQTVLGLQRTDLPCLCLVQLDDGLRYPAKKIYSLSRVKLPQVEQMAQRWASNSGIERNQPATLMTPAPGPQPATAWTTSQIRDIAQAAEEACRPLNDGQQLSAACHALNAAFTEGIQNPLQPWQRVLELQRSWQSRAGNSADELRARTLLTQLEQAYWQLNGP